MSDTFCVRLIAAHELAVRDRVWVEERGFVEVRGVRKHPLIGERAGDVDVWLDDAPAPPWMLANGMSPLLIEAKNEAP